MPKKVSVILVIVLFAAMLIFAGNKGLLSGFETAGRNMTAPVGIFFSDFSGRSSGFFSGIFKLGKLQAENAFLKDNLNRLQAEVAQLEEQKKENERLKALLGFVSANKFSYEAASVIAYDPSNIRGNLTVNKGKKDGIAEGMAVISDGFLIGRIYAVDEHSSIVRLLTDPLSAIPVSVQNTGTTGIANGQIGYGLSMEKIPQGEKITKGDTVVTSGLGGEIPRGLIVGTVEKITRQENSLFVTADIMPSADLASLSRLIIIKGQ